MRVSLLLIFLSAVLADDQFTFDVSFVCNYNLREKFNYNVQFFDKDSYISADDPITTPHIGFGSPGETYFTMFGSQHADEIFSDAYNPYMRLYHDCTEYQTEEEVYLILPVCIIGKGRCHYSIRKDIKELTGTSTYNADLKYD
uniref:Uncharacterized protein n=2 Tax=Caenorhabditis tropicalis TaxID=1561998 RepID=A0A1I7UC28_9PELO